MAEHQLPKLTVRVRFPSPAPKVKAQARTSVQVWALFVSGPLTVAVQLARLLSGAHVAVYFQPSSVMAVALPGWAQKA
jgi:hypothetical protein